LTRTPVIFFALVRWCAGALVRWCAGSLVRWVVGSLAHFCADAARGELECSGWSV